MENPSGLPRVEEPIRSPQGRRHTMPQGFHQLDLRAQNSHISRVVFRLMSKAMAAGALCWFGIALVLGLYIQSLVPLAYLLLTALNLHLTKDQGSHGFPAITQMLFSIILPFVMQMMLGGMMTSGVMMFWSFAALGGALTYRRYYMIAIWSGLEIVLITAFCLLDPTVHVGDPEALNNLPAFKTLIAINLLGPCFILLATAFHFVKTQGRVRKHNHEMKALLAESNERLERRNMEMDASLRYARTIQSALLPDLKNSPGSIVDGLLLYRPKDHVGGDLLWQGKHGAHHLIAVMDCTGHGVPGALLTVIVHNLLNEVVLLRGHTDPATIVAEVVKRIPQLLQRSTGIYQDGVELAVIRIDQENGEHLFAGTGLGLIVVNGVEHTILAGGKSLLREHDRLRPDTIRTSRLDLPTGSRLYAFTDGFWHQFGGAQGRKFSRARLTREIIGMSTLTWPEQQLLLERILDDWRGSHEQVDDILVLGFEPVLQVALKSQRA
ncbi:MAG: SpoIIE family protein phosphatase [Flavobacteriales bacterium]|nr:SpoIIE family protein phosphatase [Flavobacteriales bacterium]